jgi:ATP-dependent DNA helicase RecG
MARRKENDPAGPEPSAPRPRTPKEPSDKAAARPSSDRGESPPLQLATPLGRVPTIGRGIADGLIRLGVKNIADLLLHTPMRYERLEAEATIDQLVPGQNVSVRGDVTATRVAGQRGRQRFEAVLMDHTGRLDLVWFNMPFLQNKIYPGLRLRAQGKAAKRGPSLQLVNPNHEVLKEETKEPTAREQRIRPVYSASESVTSAQIERVMETLLEPAVALLDDHLPESFRKQRSLPTLAEAYRMAHRPESEDQWRAARRRLAYDELLMLQLGVFMRRAEQRGQSKAAALRWNEAIDKAIRARIPFSLTGSQDAVVRQIVADLTLDRPSNRLIQGDVGSGKTVVALYAMLMSVASDQQAALMAPTEILAEQHYASISKLLEGSKVRVTLLTGSITGKEREARRAAIASGDIDIVIGTHALLTEHVRFQSLAVAVIDEQHRFGVSQRAVLREKGAAAAAADQPPAVKAEEMLPRMNADVRGSERQESDSGSSASIRRSSTATAQPVSPHVLVMTATPIPRTLALTLFGDLDISTIRELPPGRTPIVTRVVSPSQSGEVYEWVRTRLDAGDQAYIVVPAIDSGASAAAAGEGGDAELNDLRTVQARMEAHELAGKKVAALHGRLSSETRDHIMHRFRAGQIDALVCTTVIEVGVDVPNATVMIIEHAERFGLAQMHQLRGRVGRGSKKSACILIGDPATPEAEARLSVMAHVSDGFVLAERDLEIRGPGEVFGLRQAGAPPFRVADLMQDRELLAMARRDAAAWIERSPRLEQPEEAVLKRRLLKAHGAWLGLGDVG